MNSIQSRKKQRFKFIQKLYELTNGDRRTFINVGDMAKLLGYTDDNFDEIKNVIDYLEGEALLKVSARINGGFPISVSITHTGIIETEAALSEPDKPTEHFPPIVNIINVETMNKSIIQQGTSNSTQAINFTQQDKKIFIDLIAELKNEISKLDIKNVEDKNDLNLVIATLENQSKTSRPKVVIIKESIDTISTILTGAAGSGVWEILQKISELIN